MGFLAQVLGAIFVPLIKWVAEMIASAISKWNAMRRAREESLARNKKLRENNEKAVTKEERDASAKDLIDRI